MFLWLMSAAVAGGADDVCIGLAEREAGGFDFAPADAVLKAATEAGRLGLCQRLVDANPALLTSADAFVRAPSHIRDWVAMELSAAARGPGPQPYDPMSAIAGWYQIRSVEDFEWLNTTYEGPGVPRYPRDNMPSLACAWTRSGVPAGVIFRLWRQVSRGTISVSASVKVIATAVEVGRLDVCDQALALVADVDGVAISMTSVASLLRVALTGPRAGRDWIGGLVASPSGLGTCLLSAIRHMFGDAPSQSMLLARDGASIAANQALGAGRPDVVAWLRERCGIQRHRLACGRQFPGPYPSLSTGAEPDAVVQARAERYLDLVYAEPG
jgi:hypothetical protein